MYVGTFFVLLFSFAPHLYCRWRREIRKFQLLFSREWRELYPSRFFLPSFLFALEYILVMFFNMFYPPRKALFIDPLLEIINVLFLLIMVFGFGFKLKDGVVEESFNRCIQSDFDEE